MGQLIEFEIGCHRCEHLIPVDKGTFMCAMMQTMDEEAIYPIVKGRKSEDWHLCDGKEYQTKQEKKVRKRTS